MIRAQLPEDPGVDWRLSRLTGSRTTSSPGEAPVTLTFDPRSTGVARKDALAATPVVMGHSALAFPRHHEGEAHG